MMHFYKSAYGQVSEIDKFEKGCLINLVNPTTTEIEYVEKTCKIPNDFILAALDDEEKSRIEEEDDNILIIINNSVKSDIDDITIYETMPMAIIASPNCMVMVGKSDVEAIKYVTNLKNAKISFRKQGRFVMQVIYGVATQYLRDLRALDRQIDRIELQLYENMTNDQLLELLKIEKTLVYYNAALSDNIKILRKLMRGRLFPRFEEDEDLMDDTLIELEQAYEMAKINADILRSVRDAISSMINNNLNSVMKTLASITIMLTIPMLVTSFFGMNVNFGYAVQNPYYVWMLITCTLVVTLIVFIVMKVKKVL